MSSGEGNNDVHSNGRDAKDSSKTSSSEVSGDGQSKATGSPMQTSGVRTSLSPVKSDESNSSFEKLSGSEAVEGSTFDDVMKTLRSEHYNISRKENQLVEGKCRFYFEQDYRCEVVENPLVCVHYPTRIFVPVAVKGDESAMEFDPEVYMAMVKLAPNARIRTRFPVPVILFDNKFICRSGSTTDWKSAMYEGAMRSDPPAATSEEYGSILSNASRFMEKMTSAATNMIAGNEKLLKQDAETLKYLKMEHVCDFMVEYEKKKAGIIISSSEIKNAYIYRSLKIEDMPYPGCEFFTSYSEANRNPEGLMFDWSAPEVERTLHLTGDLVKLIPSLDSTKMTEWDLVTITKNYLKIMLAYLVKDKGSMLVHCLSGWDRTPLFVSLLRLSLWADGVIHQSLDYSEIAYLTVAYDWYLFGHYFPNRWNKKEEVMHFCFNFLSYIATDEFSVTKMFKRLSAEERGNRKFPDYEPGRRVVLDKVRQYVLDAYQEHIIEWAEAGNVSPDAERESDDEF